MTSEEVDLSRKYLSLDDIDIIEFVENLDEEFFNECVADFIKNEQTLAFRYHLETCYEKKKQDLRVIYIEKNRRD